tara:strand:- start:78 stop:650 length:573 start_codon:yes stop_codon:yes gene_type:complete
MGIRLILAIITIAGLLNGCSNLQTRSLAYAWNHWQQGAHEPALALAETEYARYLKANELSESDVQTTASKAFIRLEDTLMVDELTAKAPDPVELLKKGPSALTIELRRDLNSDESLRVMRALQTVESLALREHALPLFAIIYRRQPFKDTLALLGQASPALRSVSVKWAALRILRSFRSTVPASDLSPDE